MMLLTFLTTNRSPGCSRMSSASTRESEQDEQRVRILPSCDSLRKSLR